MHSARNTQVEAKEVMGLLERLLKASWSPSLRNAKPIVFDFTLERWTLDPRLPRPVLKGDVANPALTVHAAPHSLMRLLTEPGYVLADYEIFMDGDASALDPVIHSLNAKQNVLALRAGKGN